MSTIDCFKHSFLGTFCEYVPIYIPHETIDRDDLGADVGEIILGGGGGEHPALVISDLDSCVLSFLNYLVDDDCDYKSEDIDKILTEKDKKYLYYRNNTFIYYYWQIIHYASFHKAINRYTEDYKFPFRDEMYIQCSIGELVFHSLPFLITDLEVVKLRLQIKPLVYHSIFSSIKVKPPEYNVYANGGNYFFSELYKKEMIKFNTL